MGKITAERLRELLSYDPETGYLTWRVRTSNRITVGKRAGSVTANGYLLVGVEGRDYHAHRLAWLHVHGEWPPLVDHINGDKTDNRLCNLRLATKSGNAANSKVARNNTSGFKGVTRDYRRWVAEIYVNGQKIRLGRFSTAEEAHAAYCEAAKQHFGDFGRVS